MAPRRRASPVWELSPPPPWQPSQTPVRGEMPSPLPEPQGELQVTPAPTQLLAAVLVDDSDESPPPAAAAPAAAGEVKVHARQGLRATPELLIAVIQTAIVHKYYEIRFNGDNLKGSL
ncbi:MAG: hypothetical protein SGPRY_013695, partial [Prymnesium sp.]